LAARQADQLFTTMDTDELSEETYKAIFMNSETFNHNLTLQFGLLANDCFDDDDYLKKANQLIIYWKKDFHNAIGSIFFDTKKPTKPAFENILLQIQKDIHKVLSIPIEKRKFEF
jgi:hypothetical protein